MQLIEWRYNKIDKNHSCRKLNFLSERYLMIFQYLQYFVQNFDIKLMTIIFENDT